MPLCPYIREYDHVFLCNHFEQPWQKKSGSLLKGQMYKPVDRKKIEKSILTPIGHLGKNHPVAEIKIQLQVPLTSRI